MYFFFEVKQKENEMKNKYPIIVIYLYIEKIFNKKRIMEKR